MPWSDHFEQQVRLKAKTELRTSMQRVRNTLPATTRALFSESIRTRLNTLDFYSTKKSMALFSPIHHKNEIGTQGIDTDARKYGLRVAYPFLEEDTSWVPSEGSLRPKMSMRFRWVDVNSSALDDAFHEQGHGFPEPLSSFPLVDEQELELVILPGLAFDPYGGRLGYGAGYYDRSLPFCTNAIKIGICFDFQLVVDLGLSETDVPVDWIVTEKQILQAIRL